MFVEAEKSRKQHMWKMLAELLVEGTMNAIKEEAYAKGLCQISSLVKDLVNCQEGRED